MISHSEALNIVLDSVVISAKEVIMITESVNRVLAEDIYSTINMPPFDKSMVDGYAILKSDISNELIIDGVVGAGNDCKNAVVQGHCIKVMTGAPVPPDTEMVVMIEDVEVIDGKQIRITNPNSSSNISPKAEDISIGDKILTSGILLKPFHCGILATLGKSHVEVFRKPRIGIIVTGDEIIEPGNELKYGQIYNSNAYQLINNCLSVGIEPEYFGIAGDTYLQIETSLNDVLSRNDVVIITGGVSTGDYDYVAPVLLNSGMSVKFDSISAQPGRPLVFATDGTKFCFGMPGNPVSGLVLFETIVKPFLFKIMGHDFKPCYFPFVLKENITRKKSGRKSFYPVKLNDDNTVSAIAYHGSAHMNAYAQAFGLIALEIGVLELKGGEQVYVRQI
jgi:molybdopterin molybdotransferase